MPTYILMSTLTPEERQTLHEAPDRLEQVNKEITDFGCKVVAQYAVLGQCDFITVIETADNETVAHFVGRLGLAGDRKYRHPARDSCRRLTRETEGAETDGPGLRSVGVQIGRQTFI
jgi:uncharacterized protein with GYD domain